MGASAESCTSDSYGFGTAMASNGFTEDGVDFRIVLQMAT
jgi:hypothetical protein